jgi:hypothetical protein
LFAPEFILPLEIVNGTSSNAILLTLAVLLWFLQGHPLY